MMTLSEAILVRQSRRAFDSRPLGVEEAGRLKQMILRFNAKEHLFIQLILDEPEPFYGLSRSYGMLKGVRHYVALLAPPGRHTAEKIGYVGEHLVLEATRMGLGTCWIGATYDKTRCSFERDGNDLFSVIAVGHVQEDLTVRESFIRGVTHRKKKDLTRLCRVTGDVPNAFWAGMEAVQKAPSARGRQPYCFTCEDGQTSARATDKTTYAPIDLGIAKCHFEIGAGGGTWALGDGGTFSFTT